jgi:hypothetical protein
MSSPNAYLFAMSAVMVQAAVIEAGPEGSVDGTLQGFVNAIAIDLADGTLDPARVQLLDDAEQGLLPDRAYELLAARLSELGIMQPPPDLDVVVDTDLDDVPNATDTCAWVPNVMQLPILDEVCHARASYVSDAPASPVSDVVLTPLDADGNVDAVMRSEGQWSFYAGDGTGGFSLQHAQMVADQRPHIADLNDDGVADIVVDLGGASTAVYLRAAGFDPLPAPVESVTTFIGGLAPIHGNMNADPYPELIRMGSIGTTGAADAPLPAWLLINDGAGGFTDGTATAIIPMGTSFSGPEASALVDVTGDGNGDLVVGGWSLGMLPQDGIVAMTFPGDGDGNLGAAIVSTAAAPPGADAMNSQPLSLVDITGDGLIDLVIVAGSSSVSCLPGNGDGTFGPVVTTDVGVSLNFATLVTTGDFTGDGIPDLLVREEIGPLEDLRVYVIPSLGGGVVGPPVSRVSRLLGPTADALGWAASADLDGNGADDLLLSTGSVATMLFTP